MLELNKKYGLGTRTFWFLYFKNGKIASCSIIGIFALIISMYVGQTGEWFSYMFATNFNGILTKGLVTLWLSAGACGVLIFLFVSLFEHFAQHKFMLDDHSFHVRRGIFMIKEKVIPYRHIQNVDIEQPYHYRLFGVVRLNITTARLDTFAETEVDGDPKKAKKYMSHEKNNLIPIIDKKIAKELAHFLVSQGDRRE